MTINEIKKLCQDFGIKPTKGKGQNFLIDHNVLHKIVAAANLSQDDYALEVGPGFGILTEQLVKNCRQVLGVELDKSLLFFLKKKFKLQENFKLIEGDILKIKNQELADKLGSESYKLVANIPYAITKPIIQKFLNFVPRPTEITVLVQKEVAKKITARPGEMSLLAISVQFYGRPKIVDIVSKESFYPVPKVDSAILKIEINPNSLPAEFSRILTLKQQQNFQAKKFWQLVKISFSSPRKQLQNNLANGFNISNSEVKIRLAKVGLKELCRAQDLSLEDWAGLYQQFVV